LQGSAGRPRCPGRMLASAAGGPAGPAPQSPTCWTAVDPVTAVPADAGATAGGPTQGTIVIVRPPGTGTGGTGRRAGRVPAAAVSRRSGPGAKVGRERSRGRFRCAGSPRAARASPPTAAGVGFGKEGTGARKAGHPSPGTRLTGTTHRRPGRPDSRAWGALNSEQTWHGSGPARSFRGNPNFPTSPKTNCSTVARTWSCYLTRPTDFTSSVQQQTPSPGSKGPSVLVTGWTPGG